MHRLLIIKFKTVTDPGKNNGMKKEISGDFKCICNFLNGGEIDITQNFAILITFSYTIQWH